MVLNVRIYRSDNGGAFELIDVVPELLWDAGEYQDEDVVAGHHYTYKAVRLLDGVETTEYSPEVTQVFNGIPISSTPHAEVVVPQPIIRLVVPLESEPHVQSGSNTQITQADVPHTIHIYRSDNGGAFELIDVVPELLWDAGEYQDEDVVAGHHYTYKAVRLLDGVETTEYSPEVTQVFNGIPISSTPHAEVVVPQPIIRLVVPLESEPHVQSGSNTQITQADVPHTIHIYRSDNGGAFELIDVVPELLWDAGEYQDEDVVAGHHYTYKAVRLLDGVETTEYSPEVTASFGAIAISVHVHVDCRIHSPYVRNTIPIESEPHVQSGGVGISTSTNPGKTLYLYRKVGDGEFEYINEVNPRHWDSVWLYDTTLEFEIGVTYTYKAYRLEHDGTENWTDEVSVEYVNPPLNSTVAVTTGAWATFPGALALFEEIVVADEDNPLTPGDLEFDDSITLADLVENQYDAVAIIDNPLGIDDVLQQHGPYSEDVLLDAYLWLMGDLKEEITVVSELKAGQVFAVEFDDSVSLDAAIDYIEKVTLVEIAEPCPIADQLIYKGGWAYAHVLCDEIGEMGLVDVAVPAFEIERLTFDDDFTIFDVFANPMQLPERMKMNSTCYVKQYTPDFAGDIFGIQWTIGSQYLTEGTTIHVIKRYSHPDFVDSFELDDEIEVTDGGIHEMIEGETEHSAPPVARVDVTPPGNMPDYVTQVNPDGTFELLDIPWGVYTIVGIRPYFEVSFGEVDLHSDEENVEITMYPADYEDIIERVYDLYGNRHKIYHTAWYEIPETREFVIEGIILFGDLYGDALPGGQVGQGYMEPFREYYEGWIGLDSVPYLGINGFFEHTKDEWVRINQDLGRIEFYSRVAPGDFDGFAFAYIYDRRVAGVLDLALPCAGIDEPEPVQVPLENAGITPSNSSGTGNGTGSRGTGSSGSYSTGGSYHYVPPAWNPNFGYSSTEVLRVGESEGAPSLHFYETFGCKDGFGTPVRLSINGVLTADAEQTVWVDPETGEQTAFVESKRIAGVTVLAVAVRTGRVMGETVSGPNGEWEINNLDSELVYQILAFQSSEFEYYSVAGTIPVNNKAVVDPILLQDSVFYVGEGDGRLYVVRTVLPPLEERGLWDGRVYGRVYDTVTDESITNMLVRVYPGHLTQEEIVWMNEYGDPSQVRSFYTFPRDYADDGYYEIYLKTGDYTVVASPQTELYESFNFYHITIAVDFSYQLDIGLEPAKFRGGIYDEEEMWSGNLVPLEGVDVVFEEVVETSGNAPIHVRPNKNGRFRVRTELERGKKYSVKLYPDDRSLLPIERHYTINSDDVTVRIFIPKRYAYT